MNPACWVRWKPNLARFVDQPRLGFDEPSQGWVPLNLALLGSRQAKAGFAGTQPCWVRLKPSLQPNPALLRKLGSWFEVSMKPVAQVSLRKEKKRKWVG
ncbi:hypothetical protein SLEP1_g41101 [Rubroshorea leprosula]|uniref:Uncharacterized protein n=1 Tax=Rubroshorea leprosula TaxID=152421 RepID=A0AAV5L6D8_9ROSI|nr:hypothetical protein SLEP1_g41101 [Rubroshorea leprosula]